MKTLFVFVFRRRLDQDEYVHLSLTCLEDAIKTSWSIPIYLSWPYVFKTSSRRLAKTSSRHLQDVLQRYLQDVFKTYHQIKLFFITRLSEAFNTFLRRSFAETVIYRGICLSNTISDKCMVSVPNLQER